MIRFLAPLILVALAAKADPLQMAVGYHGRRLMSHPGAPWLEVAPDGHTGPLLVLACDGHAFVAAGGTDEDGLTLSTNDGAQWRKWPTPPGAITAITAGRSLFVAMRGGRLLSAKAATERWTEGAELPRAGVTRAQAAACGDTEAGYRYVFIGEGTAPWRAVSEDGMRWNHFARETKPARALAYGAGIFVAAGPASLLETSHDGETWTAQTLAAPDDLETLVWTGTRFLVQGKHLHSSADGFTWRLEPEPPLGALSCGQPLLALSLGQALLSFDQGKWVPLHLPAGPALTAVAGRE